MEKDAERVEKEPAASFRSLLDEKLTGAFHILTAVRIHDENGLEGDIRAYGKSKDVGGVARQSRTASCRFRTACRRCIGSIPAPQRKRKPSIRRERGSRKLPGQAPRPGRRSRPPGHDNIGELEKLSGKDGRKHEVVLAVPARGYAKLADAFRDIEEGKVGENGERLAEMEFAGHRLAVARDPARAKERTEKRLERLG